MSRLKTAVCKHCRRLMPIKVRGLCSTCSKKPEVAAIYPCLKEQPKNYDDELPCAGTPEPVGCLPGTDGKIVEMRKRAELRLALHHPMDGRLSNEAAGTT